ncbi:MAG TPA: hypothetical protein VN408_12190 [Actinoplanes sp.]|nr:hypothetical protein [Actinoplanes sp.]
MTFPGSMMTSVLAEDATLLPAIGYREICRSEDFGTPPVSWNIDDEIRQCPIGVTAPATGLETVAEPADMATRTPLIRPATGTD